MNLTYKALDKNGRRVRDAIEASSIKEATDTLRRQGLFVTGIEAAERQTAESMRSTRKRAYSHADDRKSPRSKAGTKPLSSQSRGMSLTGVDEGPEGDRAVNLDDPSRLSLKSLLLFTRQLHMLLGSGSALVPALHAIRRQMRKQGHAAVLDSIIHALEAGQPFSHALRRHPESFDATYVSIIAAGEASASLPKALERLSRTITRRKTVRGKIVGATAYPALLIAMSMVILLLMLFFIIPRFGEMFTGLGVPLPATTQIMMGTADALTGYWPICVAVGLALVAGCILLFKTIAGRRWLGDIQTELPLVGALVTRLIQANFFRTMGALLESGVGVLEALDLARGITVNRRFTAMFSQMHSAVTSGQSMYETVESSSLVSPAICQAIRTGEESGSIGPAMSFAADLLDEENTAMVDTLTKLVEPIILIVMGAMIAGVAISLFLPMFDLTAAVRN